MNNRKTTPHTKDNKSQVVGGMSTVHIPVLLQEIIDNTEINSGSIIFDGTLGGGGYSYEFSKLAGKNGLVVATDLDQDAIARAEEKDFVSKTSFYNRAFSDVGEIAQEMNITFDLAVLDLGLSSDQLDVSARGFSFKNPAEPLDMSFSKSEDRLTAAEVANEWSEEALADIIFGFGGERYAKRIAKKLIETREESPLQTVGDLLDVIDASVPSGYKHRKTHPATKTFQALRIAVNQEWKHLTDFLENIQAHMSKGGYLAIVSFHSGEDRVVKHTFKDWHKEGKVELITKKPIMPSEEEKQQNPRSRSAVLRITKFV